MKTIVIGLGNPILGNDGLGWKIAEEVQKRLPAESPVQVEFLSLGGISLMEHLIGFERAILLDAIDSSGEAGSVVSAALRDLPDHSAFHTTSVHDTSLQNALRLGESMGVSLPAEITVVGITSYRTYEFSEEISPAVTEAIPKVVQIVMRMLA